MDELLQQLEKQIKGLIDQQDQLATANQRLNQGKSLLVREKATLLEKQKKAVSQIEGLVSRLKTIEEAL